MSFRGLFRLSTCRSISTARGSLGLQSFFLERAAYPATACTVPVCQSWNRGAKTKTVIKARDLPQGTLPPLPEDPVDTEPSKSYPRVIRQHLDNVKKFKDSVVLTRVGDFYELYGEQVNEYAHLLNLKKAKRDTTVGDVPMAGFQWTRLDHYLKVLVQDLGKQVAISEQVPIPEGERIAKAGGPLWNRRVTRVVTRGTLVDEDFVDPYESNYLLSVHFAGALAQVSANERRSEALERCRRTGKVGLSWVDLSSGNFYTQTSDLASLPSLLARIGPKEVILDSSMEEQGQSQLQTFLGNGTYALQFHETSQVASSVSEWTSMLERAVPETEQSTFTDEELSAGSLILNYIRDRLIDMDIRLQPPVRCADDEYMIIDKQSLRGLEIRRTLRDGVFQGSLLHAIRRTVTQSGARLLNERLVSPSMSLSIINNRLDLVKEMLDHDALREDVVALLRQTSDTLRLLQRFSINRGDADDLLGLARTINVMAQMTGVLYDHITANQESDESVASDYGFLWRILNDLDLDGPSKVAKTILTAIDEEGLTRKHTAEIESREKAEDMVDEVVAADAAGEKVPKLTRRGSRSKSAEMAAASDSSTEDIWIMRKNASPTLRRAHGDLNKLLEEKQQLAQTLRKQLGTHLVILKWSAKNGHFCYVNAKDHQKLPPVDGAINIASTKTSRSFFLGDWQDLGNRIDEARLRIRHEEERVFDQLRLQVMENLMKLRRNAAVLDDLDVACSSAVVAKEGDLIRPILNTSTSHKIIGGRHPTVDVGLKEQGRLFTSNDCLVGDRERIYLITGPNMGGKSTYLRQNALITILAQTGCFVPAEYAEIGLVDKVFSRVGSADNLFHDQSTFMVEMLETAEILKQATPRSFVVMDEVGRGTTPEDGVAVGYASLWYLYHLNKSRTLFATHFHGLADMTRDFKDLACYCTDLALESDGSWAFMHKLRRGVNRESHALKVARLAGMPEDAIAVARDVLGDVQRRVETTNQLLPPAMTATG